MSQLTRIQQHPHQKAAVAPEFASILIVDDNDFDRSRLKKLCRAFDFTTHVMEAARCAICATASRKTALI